MDTNVGANGGNGDKSQATEKFIDMVLGSKRLVFFGGAGVSTASGIPDFRGDKGVFTLKSGGLSPEEIVSSDYFYSHTSEFYDYYKKHLVFRNAKPNIVHKTLVQLEKRGILTAVITQNVDGLHQQAGSRNVIELHGRVSVNYCIHCGAKYGLDFVCDFDGVPRCTECGGTVKPDVVLYGEMLDNNAVERASDAIERADTLIVCGTSLVVYPAASYVRLFRGDNLIVVNKTATFADASASVVINGDMTLPFSALSSRLT